MYVLHKTEGIQNVQLMLNCGIPLVCESKEENEYDEQF